jgi:hypothetical protein
VSFQKVKKKTNKMWRKNPAWKGPGLDPNRKRLWEQTPHVFPYEESVVIEDCDFPPYPADLDEDLDVPPAQVLDDIDLVSDDDDDRQETRPTIPERIIPDSSDDEDESERESIPEPFPVGFIFMVEFVHSSSRTV